MRTCNIRSAAVATATVLIAAVGSSYNAGAQDAENGESIYRQCRICHKVGEGATNAVGPQLNGIVGRKASAAPGFNYSPASREAAEKGLVWTDANLDKYLENPRTFMPGTRMAYAGLRNESDRKDVIAYLKTFK